MNLQPNLGVTMPIGNSKLDWKILLLTVWAISLTTTEYFYWKMELPHNVPQDSQLVVDTEPANWVSTVRVVGDTYKTSISLTPNVAPLDAMRIAEYFIKQRCKKATIKRITILYTKKTNMWIIWKKGRNCEENYNRNTR